MEMKGFAKKHCEGRPHGYQAHFPGKGGQMEGVGGHKQYAQVGDQGDQVGEGGEKVGL